MKKKKTQQEIAESLAKHMPVAPVVPVQKTDLPDSFVQDTEEDYKFSRLALKGLIEQSNKDIDAMRGVASEMEHPRAYEVLSGMMKHRSEMIRDLMKLQESRQTLHDNSVPGESAIINGDQINQAVFVGSTAELQRFLADKKKSEAIVDIVEEP